MRTVAIRSALPAVVIATVSEASFYFKGLRPYFFSLRGLFDVLCFSLFLCGVIILSSLAVIKIGKERSVFSTRFKWVRLSLSVLIPVTMLYFDDAAGFKKMLALDNILGLLIIGFFVFILTSITLLGVKDRL